MDPEASSSQSQSSSTNEPWHIPLFTHVTRTSSTAHTTDIRLVLSIFALFLTIVYLRDAGWESMLFVIVGGVAIWKTARTREGGEFRRIKTALRRD
ncbi:hypothetical protein D6C82_02606 [Aureobasidium pullulans]|nr:hypothetical protein D6C82_02606 [Aureobasidium pullulans]